MNKIALIIKREYLTRVKKKSFIIMTILGPLLMGGLIIVPVWLQMQEDGDANVLVVDETTGGLFYNKIPDTENAKFRFVEGLQIGQAKKMLSQDEYSAVLHIYGDPLNSMNKVETKVYYDRQPGYKSILYIEETLENELERIKLEQAGIKRETINNAKTDVRLFQVKIEDGVEEDKDNSNNMLIGILCGVLIYFFIFLYGAQVMRGVIEEKTSRIVEVLMSSVKPFELMMGKIIGIALVGLTQFLLWVILSFTVITAVGSMMGEDVVKAQNEPIPLENVTNGQSVIQTPAVNKADVKSDDLFKNLGNVNIIEIIACFIFYFLGGYLLYGALFAAVGAAVDNETDTQQFMLPVTIPLIGSFIIAQFVMANPEGPVAFWFSIIPFTSPIVMMVRLPFGVPTGEVILSMVLLVLGFIATTWFASKIYRTGILMYGKKVNYKEIWKWIRYH